MIPKQCLFAALSLGREQLFSITTTLRKRGTLIPPYGNLPTRLTAVWPCRSQIYFRPRTDRFEEASL